MSMSGPVGTGQMPAGRVVSVTDSTGQDASGNFVRGRTVTYQLATGHTGTVFVPGPTINVDAIKAAVLAEAAKLAEVADFTFGQ